MGRVMVVEDRSEFEPGQRVRVRQEGGDDSSRPDRKFRGKEGTIQSGTGNLDGGLPTFYFVEFDRARASEKVMAISADWLEPGGAHHAG